MPGRNAPCPCGSGKKYKKCCLRAESEQASLRERYRTRRERYLDLQSRVVGTVLEEFGDDAFVEVIEQLEFYDDSEDNMFLTGECLGTVVPVCDGKLAYEWFLEKHRCEPSERELLEKLLVEPISIWVKVGSRLRDRLTGRELEMKNCPLFAAMDEGGGVLGKIMTLDQEPVIWAIEAHELNSYCVDWVCREFLEGSKTRQNQHPTQAGDGIRAAGSLVRRTRTGSRPGGTHADEF